MMVHPAWAAVERLLTDKRRWIGRMMGKTTGYPDWQIALAMAVGGYAADLVVMPSEDSRGTRYEFPDYLIACDDGETDAPAAEASPRALLQYYAALDIDVGRPPHHRGAHGRRSAAQRSGVAQ
jgi:hypothetical protein